MGHGRIVSGGADGLYQVELVRETTRMQAERARLVTRRDAETAKISTLEADLAAADAELDAALVALDAAIDTYNAAPIGQGDADAVQAAVEVTIEKRAAATVIDADLETAKYSQQEAASQIATIDAVGPDPIVSAWCADLTEDLAVGTNVGTIEIPDEVSDEPTIIRPAFDPGGGSRADYDLDRDGFLQPAAASSIAQFTQNIILLPAVQRWRPLYRLATVDAVDTVADTVDVTLDPAVSRGIPSRLYRGIDVNMETAYADVPVEYMDCNAAPFEVGDRVVLQFARDWTTPTCIGFRNDPKPCALPWVERFSGLLENGVEDISGPGSFVQSYHQYAFHRRAFGGSGQRLDDYWAPTSVIDGDPNTVFAWWITDNRHFWRIMGYGDASATVGASGLVLTANSDPEGAGGSWIEAQCFPGTVPPEFAILGDPVYESPGAFGRWFTVELSALSVVYDWEFVIDGPRQMHAMTPGLYADAQDDNLWFGSETAQFLELNLAGRAANDRDTLDPNWRTYVDPDFSTWYPGVPPAPPWGEPWFGFATSTDEVAREYGGPLRIRLTADSSDAATRTATIREVSFLFIDTSN